jgi:SAM-dependent methyltransferase
MAPGPRTVAAAAVPPPRPPRSRPSFPGDAPLPPASEYHDRDFDWDDHARVAAPVLEARLAARAAAGAAAPPPPSYDAAAWCALHARDNAAARHYRERRYLPLAFPEAVSAARIVELGAGAGASLLPLLRAGNATALATDVSPVAVRLCREVADRAGVGGRVEAAVLDATDPGAPAALAGKRADVCLVIFTLGALDRAGQAAALATAAASVRPCGRVLVRDHGALDVAHMRAPRAVDGAPVGSAALHARQDGTLCFFFTPEYLTAAAETAGLIPVDVRWVTIAHPNRATGVVLKRVMVQGVFARPV